MFRLLHELCDSDEAAYIVSISFKIYAKSAREILLLH